MKIINLFLILYLILNTTTSFANNIEFENWVKNFKLYAFKKGISQKTLDLVMEDANYLPKVIEYDRFQPEFYEDTITYISKRASNKKLNKGINLYYKNKNLINKVDKEFNVENELLIALMGIETNYGKYLGKMDIISSLATLSYDKRRSAFFTNELITILKLIDKKIVNHKILYGSWAGAFGNFQFMPSTIEKYAVDYDKNNKIELKTSNFDAIASAANYINKKGWKYDEPCFYRVKMNTNIKKKYINSSARNIKNRMSIKKWKKKGIISFDGSDLPQKYKAALILPDGKMDTPAYLVLQNYEKILKWNRSLRFAISVCTLAQKIDLQ